MSQTTVSTSHTASKEGTIPLRGNWAKIVDSITSGGAIRASTQSGGVTIEQTGTVYEFDIRGEGTMGSVVQDDLDLRLLFRHWVGGLVHPAHTTVDFIDATGAVCVSLHAADDSTRNAIEAAANQFRGPTLDVPVAPIRPSPRNDEDVDRNALLADWRAMQNVHHFEAMLSKHHIGRLQALRLAGPEFARALSTKAFGALLAKLGKDGQEIMVFVANRGMVQIFSGPTDEKKRARNGWEIAHRQTKLYVPDTTLYKIWLVNKPTAAGIITSLEFVHEDNDQSVASIFGRHPHGEAQPSEWLELLETLPGV